MRKFRKIAVYTLFLLLALGLLYYSFKGIGWTDFIGGLRSCDFKWIAGSMVVSILASYLRAVRWRLLLLPISGNVRTSETFDGVNIGYITNFIIPRAGEVSRCGVVAGTRKISFESTLGSVVVERTIDMISMMLIFFSVLFIGRDSFSNFLHSAILDSASEKFGTVLFLLLTVAVLSVPAVLYLFRKYNARLKKIPLIGTVSDMCCRLTDGLISWVKMRRKWEFLLHTVLIWVCYWLMSYFTVLAFPGVEGLGASDALFLMIAGSLGWVVPVQGGIGAYHFIVSLALSTVYGISQTDGIVFATISHTSQTITMILCGIYSLISIVITKNRYLNQTPSIPENKD